MMKYYSGSFTPVRFFHSQLWLEKLSNECPEDVVYTAADSLTRYYYYHHDPLSP